MKIYRRTKKDRKEHHDITPTKVTLQHNLLPQRRICTKAKTTFLQHKVKITKWQRSIHRWVKERR